MAIERAGYEKMDWLKALEAKPKDPVSDLGQQKEEDLIDSAIETTAKVTFDLPVVTENKYDALRRTAKEIADKKEESSAKQASDVIRTKMSENGIDPVSMGFASKEQWEKSLDPQWVEKVAKKAAEKYEKDLRRTWEHNALKPTQPNMHFDPKVSNSSMITSMSSTCEDVVQSAGLVPKNTTSILDPNRLDNFVANKNEHDEAVSAAKEAKKARQDQKKAELAPKEDPNQPSPMHGGQVISTGAYGTDMHRIPKNQLSIMDNLGDPNDSSDQLKDKLASLFTRIEDNGEVIREQNKQKTEQIRGASKRDRSWEEVNKPVSTSELSQRLMDSLWPKNTEK